VTRIIFHIDDVGATHGSNVAMEVLNGTGLITSGSIVVPSGWFPEAAALARRRTELDLGVHLALTSESASYRWRPLSTSSRTSGLIDDDGCFWADVPSVRRHAQPDAVRVELEAQIMRAQQSGIEITHLDHHMGAALVPEFAALTVDLAIQFGLPTLFPTQFDHYAGSVELGDEADGLDGVDLAEMQALRGTLDQAGLAVADRFVIGLRHVGRPARSVYEELLGEVHAGTTFVSLHCNAPGEVSAVHPRDAAFRVQEFDLFGDPVFINWVTDLGWEPVGFRDLSR